MIAKLPWTGSQTVLSPLVAADGKMLITYDPRRGLYIDPENLDYITRAVNTHKDLTDALRKMIESTTTPSKARDQAILAIAKATEKLQSSADTAKPRLARAPFSHSFYECRCGATYKNQCDCIRDINRSNIDMASSGVALSSNTDCAVTHARPRTSATSQTAARSSEGTSA